MADLKKLGIYQIYFDEKSHRTCEQEWNHYNNEGKLTEFFENTVIVDLIERQVHKPYEYFGVFSHDIRNDRVYKEDTLRFNPSTLERVVSAYDVDVFSFEKRRRNTNIITQAENYHHGFIKIIERILEETKFLPVIPKKLDNIILFNHFIARSEIYDQYVNELLIPAMKILKEMPEAYKDSNYIKRVSNEMRARFMQAFGQPHYPYHPFICERLPSLFLSKYRYSCKQIF